MNTSKYLSALLYALEMPMGVWAGIELDHKHYWLGIILISLISVMVAVGVFTFMDGQARETKKVMEQKNE